MTYHGAVKPESRKVTTATPATESGDAGAGDHGRWPPTGITVRSRTNRGKRTSRFAVRVDFGPATVVVSATQPPRLPGPNTRSIPVKPVNPQVHPQETHNPQDFHRPTTHKVVHRKPTEISTGLSTAPCGTFAGLKITVPVGLFSRFRRARFRRPCGKSFRVSILSFEFRFQFRSQPPLGFLVDESNFEF